MIFISTIKSIVTDFSISKSLKVKKKKYIYI